MVFRSIHIFSLHAYPSLSHYQSLTSWLNYCNSFLNYFLHMQSDLSSVPSFCFYPYTLSSYGRQNDFSRKGLFQSPTWNSAVAFNWPWDKISKSPALIQLVPLPPASGLAHLSFSDSVLNVPVYFPLMQSTWDNTSLTTCICLVKSSLFKFHSNALGIESGYSLITKVITVSVTWRVLLIFVALNWCFYHILLYKWIFKDIYHRNSFRSKKKYEIMSDFYLELNHLIVNWNLKMTWFRLFNRDFKDGENSSFKFTGNEMVIMLFYQVFAWREKHLCNKLPNNIPYM